MSDRPPGFQGIGRYLSLIAIGMEMVVPIGVGMLMDRRWDWTPWATLVGVVVGFVTGIIHTMTIVNRQNNGANRSEKDSAR